jgi:thiol-disulfide isomerase/thioredoxin
MREMEIPQDPPVHRAIWPSGYFHKMLLSSFFCLSCSYFPFQSPVIEGTTDNWVSEVSEYVANHGVVFVLFVQKRSPPCKALFPDFQEAANQSNGMVKFVSVDIKANPKISHLYTVRAPPAFRIVHPKGSVEYKGDTSFESLLDAAFKLIPSNAKTVDPSWAPSPTTPMSAILLTNKKVIPPFWAAISNAFLNSDIRIGWSRSPQMMPLFGVSTSISIVFTSQEIVFHYNGQLTYPKIYDAIKAFQANPIASDTSQSLVSELENPEVFEENCRNTGKMCVFGVNLTKSEEYEAVAKANHHGPFRFFKCAGKCPFPGMNSGFFVFHARRETVVSVSDVSDLATTLDRVIDGGARWEKFARVFGAAEEGL